MANKSMSAAKNAKNDEFYTQYADIQKEMNAYIMYNPNVFRGKTVLLPCDDPEWSNFTRFFAQNFEFYGLKKLISTSYAIESKKYRPTDWQPTLFEQTNPMFDADKSKVCGKIFILERDTTGDNHIDIEDLEWHYLEGDGDFRSEEVTRLRDEADIIITNPPFSLFKEFIPWIIESGKLFAVIGNENEVTKKYFFPLIKSGAIWLGATGNGVDMVFGVPAGAEVKPKDREKAAKMGYVGDYTRQGNSCWFTNIEHGNRHEPLLLMTMADNRRYNKFLKGKKGVFCYQTYDNYDAINIERVEAIPSDYDGIMGVPITFLEKLCPEQFEIVGLTQIGCHDELPDTRKYGDYQEMRSDTDKPTGSSGNKTNENAVLLGKGDKDTYYMNKEGRMVHSRYKRLLIRRK